MKLKLFEEFIKESQAKDIETTVGELFTWYAGEDWEKDWQTANTMTVDGKHAQDIDDSDGLDSLKLLKEHEDDVITVECVDEDNAWDLNFEVADIEFSIQSAALPFE